MTDLEWLKEAPTQREFIRNCVMRVEAQGVIWALQAAGIRGRFVIEQFRDLHTSGYRDLFTVYREPLT